MPAAVRARVNTAGMASARPRAQGEEARDTEMRTEGVEVADDQGEKESTEGEKEGRI